MFVPQSQPKRSVEAAIKLYLFPSLVTILSLLIWRDVSELRSDVKSLLAQSNIDKTKIENLERVIYNKKISVSAELKDILLFKHEDIYQVDENVATI